MVVSEIGRNLDALVDSKVADEDHSNSVDTKPEPGGENGRVVTRKYKQVLTYKNADAMPVSCSIAYRAFPQLK